MKISTISPMLAALNQPASRYQPDFPNLALAAENGDTGVSIANLRALYDEGLRLVNLLAGEAGLLFIFATGEQYLATGLHAGSDQAAGPLAELMSEWQFGDVEELTAFYAALPEDYHGMVPLG